MINLNVRSAQMLTRFALPHLKASAQASGETSAVILVGSVAAHLGGGPGASLYGGAKAWLHNVQKNWVSYHTADGIRFNTVSPGTFDTAFHADKSAEVKARISTGIPMGRFGRAEDVRVGLRHPGRVVVPDDQLSLAIGKEGQNARLAARLTGYKIDIKPESGFYEPKAEQEEEQRHVLYQIAWKVNLSDGIYWMMIEDILIAVWHREEL